MFEDIAFGLSPYLFHSKKLMEFFVIIGYKEENLIENCPYLTENQENLELTVLSVCATNKAIDFININYIMNNIYPYKPNIIKIERPETKPTTSSVVFWTNETSSFYSCYGLRFYEKFTDVFNMEYYVPKAFLIVSEYPYFTTFNKICYNLYKINIEEKEKERKSLRMSSKKITKKEFYEEERIPLEILIHCFVNYIPSPLNNIIQLKLFNNEINISIPRIGGCPYIDFDLCQIFNIISINEFIKLFILVFSEVSLVLISEDITKLSLIMYTLYILNYPLMESAYLRGLKILPKSKKVYNLGIPTFFGINTEFYNDFKFTNEIKVVFDIDKQKFYNSNESIQIKNLLEYINNILNNKKHIKSTFLLKLLPLLKNKLEQTINKYKKKAKHFSIDVFLTNDIINSSNIEIQEAFYDFILNIIIILNKDYQINEACSLIEKKAIRKNINLSEEDYLIKKINESDKYNIYYHNFTKEFKSSDEFRIPLLLFDEFAQQRRYDSQNKIPQYISYFKIINYIYSTNPSSILIDYNYLFKGFKELNSKNITEKRKKANEKKSQLFYLDKNKINNLLYYIKNNKNVFKDLKEKEKKEITIESVERMSIFITIQNSFSKILNPNYFIRASLVFIFSIVFPIFSSKTIETYLVYLTASINKMEYFQRSYLYIMLRSINKYYSKNKENNQFSELNYKNIRSYCQKIKLFLNDCSIIPYKEIFLFLKEILNNNNNENENKNNDKGKDNNDDNKNDDNENNKEHNFVFKYDKVENYVNAIKFDIIEKESNTLFFKYQGKKIEHNFLTFGDIFQQSYSIYDDYFSRVNCNIENLLIPDVINIIVNLIYYFLLPKFDEKDLALFLFKTIIVLNKLEKDLKEYKKNNK